MSESAPHSHATTFVVCTVVLAAMVFTSDWAKKIKQNNNERTR